MKRIYNDIPLASVTSFMPGYIFLSVIDLKASDIHYNRENAEPVGTWQGYAKDSYKIPSLYSYAKVYHMEIPDRDHVVFYISTQNEWK